jgi:hypothetical protein
LLCGVPQSIDGWETLQRIAWKAPEHARKDPFKDQCRHVIHSVIEIVGVALEGNEILGDLFDVVVDQSFVQEQISSVVRMMNL